MLIKGENPTKTKIVKSESIPVRFFFLSFLSTYQWLILHPVIRIEEKRIDLPSKEKKLFN